MKFTGKSLESLFTLLENQANLLLGKREEIFLLIEVKTDTKWLNI